MVKAGRMCHELEAIFRELGISQYLDTFVEQGFDSWETILDIQESDLDALGVKLGHRRKLQRRIANARGIDPGISLSSPTKGLPEDLKQNRTRTELALADSGAETPIVTKRKYRRHPKADENGPDRPPSAYVLFSNELREGLKGQTLTFTEIAKLVGENWQSLSPTEREKYESQANAAKERYHREMANYKRSAEYHEYMKYLQEFKEKQGKLNQGQETTKRPKLDHTQLAVGNGMVRSTFVGASAVLGGSTSIASGSSSSERARESESGQSPSTRRHASVTSAASVTESHPSSTATNSVASVPSPRTAYLDNGMSQRGKQRHSRRSSTLRGNGHQAETIQKALQKALPPLSGRLSDSQRGFGGPLLVDCQPFVSGFTPANPRHPLPQSSSAFASVPVSSHLQDSMSSGAAAPIERVARLGRRSSDAPLAIHALLSDHSSTIHHQYKRAPSSLTSTSIPLELGKPLFGQCQGPREDYGFQNPISAFQHMKVEDVGDGDVLMLPMDQTADVVESNGKYRFDGMKALLKAGEIVGRNYPG